MNFFDVIIIALALAMDAFGVTLAIGLNPLLEKEYKIKFIISFSIFQLLFTYIGGSLGYLFDTYITTISSIAGGIIMEIVGLLIIIDGTKEREKELLNKNSTCILLGISVSIDALVIGFTIFHEISKNLLLLINSTLIGLITLFICSLGFYICGYMKRIKFIIIYSNFFAGLSLIFFGFKMIFF